MPRFWMLLSALALIGLLAGCGAAQTPVPGGGTPATATATRPALPTATPVVAPQGWSLVWQDEFDGRAGVVPSGRNWDYDSGGDGWNSQDRAYYTSAAENAALDGSGLLLISARKVDGAAASLNCWYGACSYTSARLVTRGRFNVSYGRIEARLRLPAGQGVGAAFWMLGVDASVNPWPANGEIDIMQTSAKAPGSVWGGVNGPGYSGAAAPGAAFSPSGASLSADFHVFAVEWDPEEMRWYVDGQQYFSLTPDKVAGKWVFDHPFYLGLNLGVGGSLAAEPDASATFPQTLAVDYVRVFQRTQ
jgi:beta-glucanase (GH16 family)